MNYKIVESEPSAPKLITVADMKIGDIGQITGRNQFHNGHFIVLTFDRRLVSLTNPAITWSHPESIQVRKLREGEKLSIVGTRSRC